MKSEIIPFHSNLRIHSSKGSGSFISNDTICLKTDLITGSTFFIPTLRLSSSMQHALTLSKYFSGALSFQTYEILAPAASQTISHNCSLNFIRTV